MKPIDKTSVKKNNELGIADLLCSAGYLPPRNEQDVERFERIYSGRIFEIEAYTVNAKAIFDKVAGEDKTTTRRFRPETIILNRPKALRVAEGTSKSYDDSVSASTSMIGSSL